MKILKAITIGVALLSLYSISSAQSSQVLVSATSVSSSVQGGSMTVGQTSTHIATWNLSLTNTTNTVKTVNFSGLSAASNLTVASTGTTLNVPSIQINPNQTAPVTVTMTTGFTPSQQGNTQIDTFIEIDTDNVPNESTTVATTTQSEIEEDPEKEVKIREM